MKIEVVRGSRLNQPSTQQSFDPSIKNDVSQNPDLLGRVGFSALKGAESTHQAISSALGERPLFKKPVSEQLLQQTGVTEEQLKPQSLAESYGQRIAQFGPTAALSGPASLLNTAVGSIPAAVAERAGAPEYVQDLVQLGTEIGLGAYAGRIPTIRSAQKANYDLARSLVSKSETGASPILNAINDVGKKLTSEVNPKITQNVEHALKTISDNMSEKNIHPNTAMDLRKKLYQFRRKLPQDAHTYIDTLTNGINDFFAVYAAENPRFFKHLKVADKLTEAKNMNSYINKFIDRLPLGSEKGPLKTIAKTLLGSTVGEVEKFSRRIINNPVARSHYFDVVQSVAKEDPYLLFKNLTNLQDSFLKEDPVINQLMKSKPKYNYELVQGSKI